jgi:hypothetical protein
MYEGIVQSFNEERQFGFIEYHDESGRCKTVFFMRDTRYCVPDEVGRVGDCAIPNTPVRFELVTEEHRGVTRLAAKQVCPVFREPFVGNAEEHREVSRVRSFLQARHGGFLRREDGSDLFFEREFAAALYRERFGFLNVGDFVYHGVEREADGSWKANNLEFYSEKEQARLQAGLPLSDPEPEPQSEPQPEPVPVVAVTYESELLAPENRKKTLYEIMQERRR